jgi:hypothetical protein
LLHSPLVASDRTHPLVDRAPQPDPAWAALMLRAVDSDVLRCSTCAGRMQLMAPIDDEAPFDFSGAR